MKINFHHHQINHPYYSYRIGIDREALPKNEFSAGIHPWDIAQIDLNAAYTKLHQALMQENCIALGECGFDKNFGTDLVVQKEVLLKQITLAQQSDIKVLIIHCVKAYQDIIEVKKSIHHPFTWVLHAFNGSKQLIKQLLKQDFYFSVGSAAFHPGTKISQTIKEIPISRLFLETDDTEYTIEEVYKQISILLNMDINHLEKQIEENRKSIFQ